MIPLCCSKLVALKGRHTVSVSIRPFRFSRLARAVAALWLWGSGAAWAGGGGGGEDLGTLNSALLFLCNTTLPLFGVTVPSCPQLPSVTQGVLQLAAWQVVPPEALLATNNIPLDHGIDAGNPSLPPATIALTDTITAKAITTFPVPATTDSTKNPPVVGLSDLLPKLRPLAFISSAQTGQGAAAAAAQLYNTGADTFLYAVASELSPSTSVQPDAMYFFYEDLSRINQTFTIGQIAAYFSLPLTVLSKNGMTVTESQVTTTLQVKAVCNGGPACLQAFAVGGIGGSSPSNPLPASNFGIKFALVFASSPISPNLHAIFELQVPLVLTFATDPIYFPNPIANIGGPPFVADTNVSIGLGPTAVPLCTPAKCPTPPATPPAPVFALCASLPDNTNGPAARRKPAVAAYYALATTGETLLSAALPASSNSVCPF
jgi:hypothetical protein